MIGHWSVSLAKYRSLIGVKLKQNRLRRTPTLSLSQNVSIPEKQKGNPRKSVGSPSRRRFSGLQNRTDPLFTDIRIVFYTLWV